jgi:hypothetical protein
VLAYAAELNKRCRQFLKPTNKSYRIDETYIDEGPGQVFVSSSGEECKALHRLRLVRRSNFCSRQRVEPGRHALI